MFAHVHHSLGGIAMLVRVSIALLCALLMVMSAEAQPTNVKTVFVVVMENHNWSQFRGASNAPYINNTLLPQASHAEQYYNPPNLHPSLPNYLWMEAGTNFGILNDNDPSINHQSTTAHLVTQLNNAGISWKTYQEDISGTNCPLTSVNKYAPKHNPFVYFDDVTNTNDPNSANCILHVRPFTELATDLQNNTVAQYVFITPNLCDDGHDSCAPVSDPIRQTDNWLQANMPMILNSTAYQNGGAIFITWDEGVGGDGPIGMIVLSPYAKGGGYSNTIHYTHGSLLRTVEEIFAVSLLGDAAVQTDLSDLFNNPNPPPAPTNLTAVPGDSSVALSWTASAGATSYNVKRSLTSGGSYTTIASVTTTSFPDSGLTNGVTYYYVVSASNLSGESSNSTEASATPNVAAPPAPTNLTAAAGNQQVTLNWSAAPGAVSYQVNRGTANGGPYDTIVHSGITGTSDIDNTVVNGTTYYYVVTAFNSGGQSPDSNQAIATPMANPVPVLQVNSGGGTVGSFVSDTGFNGGQSASTSASIDLSGVSFPAPQAVYQTWRTGAKKAANFSYTLTGFSAGTSYSLRLHFAENSVTRVGARRFDVTINGVKVLSAFDVLAAAGGKNKAVIKNFSTTADASGQIVISFTAVTAAQDPIINGIEVDQ
jgi:phosphatidylinositol-3-phosphatase